MKAIALDAGYFGESNVDHCHADGIDPFNHPSAMDRFTEPPPLIDGARPVQKMAHKLKTLAGKKIYALRKQTVEPVFGIIKSIMVSTTVRGLAAADNEWNMVCLSWNLKRMAVLRLQ